MDIRSRNEEVSPQLLDLISKDTGWPESSEERKLELRLGPPGEDWSLNRNIKNLHTETREKSLLSLGYFSAKANGCQSQSQKLSTSESPNGPIMSSPWASSSGYQGLNQQNHQNQPKASSYLDLHSNAENKAFSPSSAAKTAVTSSSQKRTAPGPVVGWPPIRSFRKNLASSSSSKAPSESQHQQDKVAGKKPAVDNSTKGLFVKINMDGVPIGRKVDLNAYGSYEKLSSAVDQLFRGLLAAQRDSSAGGIQNKQEEEKAITGSLDGSGEYTLVYEDNEGDRMLVGDVPWHMFVSTVRRLRVLKSSELSAFTVGSKQDRIPTNKAV